MSLTPSAGFIPASANAITPLVGTSEKVIQSAEKVWVIGAPAALSSGTVTDTGLFKPICTWVPSRKNPPSKSFRPKMMFSLKSASLMTTAAATAGLGAISAIAAIARHDDSRRFILTSPFALVAGLAGQVPRSPPLFNYLSSQELHWPRTCIQPPNQHLSDSDGETGIYLNEKYPTPRF